MIAATCAPFAKPPEPRAACHHNLKGLPSSSSAPRPCKAHASPPHSTSATDVKRKKEVPAAAAAAAPMTPVRASAPFPPPSTAEASSSSSSGSSSFPWNVVASSQAFANQLLSHFARWPSSAAAGSQQGSMPQAEQVLLEASSLEKEKQLTQVPADITPYLHPVAVWEMKHLRKLAHLSGLTYKSQKVNPDSLRRRHNLDLVLSSWACTLQAFDPRTAAEVVAEGDGMGMNIDDVTKIYNACSRLSSDGEQQGAAASSAPAPPPSTRQEFADAVTSKLTEAAMAASAAAAAAASPLASAAGSIYAGLSALPLPNLRSGGGGGGGGGSSPPAVSAALVSSIASVALQEARQAASGNSSAPAPSSTTSIALQAVRSSMPANPAPASPANPSQSSSQSAPSACPSEWFVCDDPVHHTRIFVIQGSDTIDHWKLNLTFDPVTFEDAALGVTVHRGVYEAAQTLYDKFLPLVLDHLESSPFARVTFTGHSIGGSMAVLLMLMYKRRGVLNTSNISTVYTFGAPSVFCEDPSPAMQLGANGPASGSGPGPAERQAGSAAAAAPARLGGPSRLLSTLGLAEPAVRNVMMHRDIVPRAFACDYSLVADILKGWGSSFRGHVSLSLDGRKHLYYFVGRMIVLQPDRWHSFVNNDPDHPLLPPGPGLHYIAEPSEMLVAGPSRGGGAGAEAAGPAAAPARKGGEAASSRGASAGAGARGRGKIPGSARAALMELMDCPHPLETLADPGAYLDTGSISRYHNPDHYTLAFGRITYLRRKQELSAAGRPMLLWPLESLRGELRGSDVLAAPGLWDSSDDSDAPHDPISLPAESSLYI